MIRFRGEASDPEDGDLSGTALSWQSSRDGSLGTGETVSRSDLTPGDHRVTLTATDSQGTSRSDAISIQIVPVARPNEAPDANISRPTDGDQFVAGDAVEFVGDARDTEDGDLQGDALVWTSDRDGEIGRGQSFEEDNLSMGDHDITLTATDSEGETGIAQVRISVEVGSVDRVEVTTAQPAVDETGVAQFQARAFDKNGNPVQATFDWSSSDPSIATVDPAGGAVSVQTIRPGEVDIVAEVNGVQGSGTLTVQALPEGRAEASDDFLEMFITRNESVEVKVFSVGGIEIVRDIRAVRFTETNDAEDGGNFVEVLEFEPVAGAATALKIAAGRRRVRIRGGQAGSTSFVAIVKTLNKSSDLETEEIEVSVLQPASIEVSPLSDVTRIDGKTIELQVGDKITLGAEAFDSDGNRLGEQDFVWDSADPDAVEVLDSQSFEDIESFETIQAFVGPSAEIEVKSQSSSDVRIRARNLGSNKAVGELLVRIKP